ncbi:MAG: YesL family protein [Kineothrix sp.]|jgi:uncharacterized membrane protein YesL|nr:hypothetical protein C807_03291 [Lachnospiraceae bacterium 28-4]MCI8845292.1 YesL family protein [Lachnospiraceae bacterium]MCX4343000.1 YesL family protein [Kineothrix sp.]
MGRFFNIDSPIMHFLGRVADLMILNLVTLICCLPVVTIGASLTAMHYVLLKMVRNRESYIVRSFFKSFKANFKQATIIWMIILLLLVVFIMDLRIINDSSLGFPQVLKIMVYALLMVAYMVICYVFPVLSRFENTVVKTMKNALFMAILSFPKTVLMMVVYLLPLAIAYFVVAAVPVVFLFGLSAPSYAAAMLYNGTFKRFEPEEEAIVDRFETGEGIDMTED